MNNSRNLLLPAAVTLVALVAISVVTFAQVINVVDYGPATPTEDIRPFGYNVFQQVPIAKVASEGHIVQPRSHTRMSVSFDADADTIVFAYMDNDASSTIRIATLSTSVFEE